MAQENANILHAAIQIRGFAADDPATDPPQIVAATGVELANVVLRADLPAIAPFVLQVDLVTGIDDSELINAWMTGTAAGPAEVGQAPVPTATLNTTPDNIMRPDASDTSPANLEKRRFWIALVTDTHSFHVAWWRIPLIGAVPTGFVPNPAPPG